MDFYHVLERLRELFQGLYVGQPAWAQRMEDHWKALLQQDRLAEVSAAARRRLLDLGCPPDDALEKQIAYFEHQQGRMRYQTYREQGLFYGSGVIEAGCKAVIGQRLKESGMFWTERGATSVLTLRCALKGNRWDECWDRLHDSHRRQCVYLRLRHPGRAGRVDDRLGPHPRVRRGIDDRGHRVERLHAAADDAISHRGKAFRALAPQIRQLLG